MNISMNFNMNECIENTIDKNNFNNYGETKTNSFEKIISNIIEKDSLQNNKNPEHEYVKNIKNQKELESCVSSLEEFLTDLNDESKDTTLNEDFSFFQNIVQLLVSSKENIEPNKEDISCIKNNSFNNEDLNYLKTIKYNTISTEGSLKELISTSIEENLNSNLELNNEVEKINNIDVNKITFDIPKENLNNVNKIAFDIPKENLNNVNKIDFDIPKENLNNVNKINDITPSIKEEAQLKEIEPEGINLILEFMDTLDEESILAIDKLNDNSIRKDILIDSFKEFLSKNYNYTDNSTNINNLNIDKNIDMDVFYNNLKTPYNTESIKTDKNIKLLDSNELIEFLSNSNVNRNNNSDVSSNFIEKNNFTLRQDNITQDLQSNILYMKNTNIKQLKLKLTPRELGELVIDISQVDNTSNITLTVSNKETLSLIQNNLKEIINNLKDMNLISDNSSVIVQSDNSKNEFLSNSNAFSKHQNKKHEESKGNFDIDSLDNLDNNIDIKIKSDSKLNILA